MKTKVFLISLFIFSILVVFFNNSSYLDCPINYWPSGYNPGKCETVVNDAQGFPNHNFKNGLHGIWNGQLLIADQLQNAGKCPAGYYISGYYPGKCERVSYVADSFPNINFDNGLHGIWSGQLLIAQFRNLPLIDRPVKLLDHSGDADFYQMHKYVNSFILIDSTSNRYRLEETLNFYYVNALKSIKYVGNIDPSKEDPKFDYCFVWAPTMYSDKNSNSVVILFSAVQFDKSIKVNCSDEKAKFNSNAIQQSISSIDDLVSLNRLNIAKRMKTFAISLNRNFLEDQFFYSSKPIKKIGRSDDDENKLIPLAIHGHYLNSLWNEKISSGTFNNWVKIDPFVFEDYLYFVSEENWVDTSKNVNIYKIVNHIDRVNKNNFNILGLNGWSQSNVTLMDPLREPFLQRLVNGFNSMVLMPDSMEPGILGIAEGPSLFRFLQNKTILFFQGFDWGSNYSVFYSDLSSGSSRDIKMFLSAIKKDNDLCRTQPISKNVNTNCYYRNYGISKIIWYQNQHYILYHVLDRSENFRDNYPRVTWIAPINVRLNAKNEIEFTNPTEIKIKFSNLQLNRKLSLNFILNSGVKIVNCYYDEKLKNSLKVDSSLALSTVLARDTLYFNGICKGIADDDKKFIGIEKIKAIEIVFTDDNWQTTQQRVLKLDFNLFEHVINL